MFSLHQSSYVFIICGPTWVGRLSTGYWTNAGGPKPGVWWIGHGVKGQPFNEKVIEFIVDLDVQL